MCGGWGTSLYHEWPLIAFAFPQIFLQYSRMKSGRIILLAKLNYVLSPVFSNEQPIQNYDIAFNFQSTQPDFHQTPNNRQNLNGKHFRKAKERFAMISGERKGKFKSSFVFTHPCSEVQRATPNFVKLTMTVNVIAIRSVFNVWSDLFWSL